MDKIYSAIIGVMSDIGAIGKTDKNKQQGFMYRGVDAVMNALQPVLIKNKVFVVPKVLEEAREERQTAKGGILFYTRLKMEYRFYADDGSSISSVVIGEAMDSGDKATNKAMSVAYKYACFQVFSIPTEEMKDSDQDSYTVEPEPEKLDPEKVTVELNHITTLKRIMERKGVSEEKIVSRYGKESIEQLTMSDFMRAMKALEKTQDLPKEEDVDLGL